MPEAWRLVREHYSSSAFCGEGAAKAGGRWNSRGMRVVYASATKSLAALETLVHLNPRMDFRYVFIRVYFSPSLIEVFPEARLPLDWKLEPPSATTKVLGDEWLDGKRSAVLQVPSVLISSEANFLLNPAHPDFARIKISKPENYAFDSRLIR